MRKYLLLGLLIAVAAAGFADDMAGGMVNDRSFIGRWRWTSVSAAGQTVELGDDANEYLITFEEDGSFKVMADCRQGSGTYRADSGVLTLHINSMSSTTCEAGSYASQMVEILEAATFQYSFTADTAFNLKFAAGTSQATFLKTNDAL